VLFHHRSALALGVLTALALFTVPGCRSRESADPAATVEPTAPEDTPAAPPAVPMVRVRGVVRLAADSADLPGFELADIGRDGSRPGVPAECSPARASDLRPMALSPERGVGGVLVTATGDPARFRDFPAGEPRSIPLGIRDCRLDPTLVVAMVGDTLALTNHSPTAFITNFTTDPINEALAPNRVRQLEVIRPGVQRVSCSMVAGCGRTDVVVLAHRAATVTAADGSFELDVPAGADVDLHAWHPLLGRREGTGRLPAADAVAGETRSVDVTLSIPRAGEPNLPVAPGPEQPGVVLH
jgi:hypothetical protein